jgi:hypothetical protein
MDRQININPQTLKNLRCVCGGMFFNQVFVIKRIPKFMAGTPVDAILHVQVWQCQECKTLLPDCLPGIKEPEPTKTN